MPFPSRETASATKCHHVKCHQLFCWRHQKQQSCTLEPSCGIRFLALVLYIYSGNTLQYIFMYDSVSTHYFSIFRSLLAYEGLVWPRASADGRCPWCERKNMSPKNFCISYSDMFCNRTAIKRVNGRI